ncbi:MAG: efflux RND transporter periplasmic adaptor subunit [Candidatus Roizmanbacteria bacterium]|nr:efflux RND transporter periplasmic adaptor subunit [Candidatus Roizmanbacteria bacterium]
MKKIKHNSWSFIVKKTTGSWGWFKKLGLWKKVALVIGILVLLFIIKSVSQGKKQPLYITTKVELGNIVELVSETGNVSSGGRVNIYSPTSGIITKLYVQNGDIVNTNDPLFEVQSTATEQEKANLYANYTSALSALKTAQQSKLTLQSQLETARKAVLDAQSARSYLDYKRSVGANNPETGRPYTQEEIDSKDSARTISQESFTATEKKYLEADTAIAAAQASAQSTYLAYNATQSSIVKATAPGTIYNLAVQTGDTVKALLSTNASTLSPVIVVAQGDSAYIVSVELNEVDIAKVKPANTAEITIDAVPQKTFPAIVERVDTYGHDEAGVILYTVYLRLKKADPAIRPLMTANVDIEVAKKENILLVPNSAVKPYKGGKAVQVLDVKTKQPIFVPVTIGLVGIEKTQIMSGIKEGTEVITALQNGQVTRSTNTVPGGQ